MKLYRKQLSGLQDLEREKLKLRYQKMHLDQIRGENTAARNGAATPGLLGMLMELAGDQTTTNIALQAGKMLLGGMGKKGRKARGQAKAAAHLPKQKSTGRKVVEDIVWSYVVGKALRVSANILKDVIRERKRHKVLR